MCQTLQGKTTSAQQLAQKLLMAQKDRSPLEHKYYLLPTGNESLLAWITAHTPVIKNN